MSEPDVTLAPLIEAGTGHVIASGQSFTDVPLSSGGAASGRCLISTPLMLGESVSALGSVIFTLTVPDWLPVSERLDVLVSFPPSTLASSVTCHGRYSKV